MLGTESLSLLCVSLSTPPLQQSLGIIQLLHGRPPYTAVDESWPHYLIRQEQGQEKGVSSVLLLKILSMISYTDASSVHLVKHTRSMRVKVGQEQPYRPVANHAVNCHSLLKRFLMVTGLRKTTTPNTQSTSMSLSGGAWYYQLVAHSSEQC